MTIQELLEELFYPEEHAEWLNTRRDRFDGLTAQEMMNAGRGSEVEALLSSIANGPVHVMPIGDLIEHTSDGGEDCLCGPTTEPVPREDGSMGWLVVHHSLDAREKQEKEQG